MSDRHIPGYKHQRDAYGGGEESFGDGEGADYPRRPPKHEVAYSMMDPKMKADVRKKERDEKKEKERAMGYFMSVKRAIEDACGMNHNNKPSNEGKPNEDATEGNKAAADVANDMDAAQQQETISIIVDGFLSELQQRMKDDLSFLRNAAVCRVLELVVSKASLKHTKVFLMLMKGHIADMMFSPTASYILETAIASIYHNLSTLLAIVAKRRGLLDGASSFSTATVLGTLHNPLLSPVQGEDELMDLIEEAEGEGGAGRDDVGAAVMSAQEVVQMIVDEIVEVMGDVLTDMPASRTLRSVMMCFSGHPIRGVPRPIVPAKFPTALAVLCESAVGALEAMFMKPTENANSLAKVNTNNVVSPSEAWFKASTTIGPSAIVEALLICDGELGSVFVKKVERLFWKGSSVLQLLMADPVGSRVFQTYLRLAKPIYADGGAVSLEYGCWDKALHAVSSSTHLEGLIRSDGDAMSELSVDHPEARQSDIMRRSEAEAEDNEGDGAAEQQANNRRSSVNPTSSPVFFALQDLITFCPTEDRLAILWNQVLLPRLTLLVSSREYGVLLTKFTRKLAFYGVDEFILENSSLSLSADDSSGMAAIQKALHAGGSVGNVTNGQLEEGNARSDMLRLGAPYFVVSNALKEEVCVQLCKALKESPIVSEGKKGAAQALLVEKVLGEQHGSAVVYNLLRMGPKVCSHLFNSFDKVKVDDIATVISGTIGGSCVLQRFIHTAVAKDALSPPTPSSNAGNAQQQGGTQANKGSSAGGALLRFVRRIEGVIGYMACGKFGGFVVECAYEQSNVEGKETIVKGLLPVYAALFGGAPDQKRATRDNGWPAPNATVNKDGLRIAAPRNVVKSQPTPEAPKPQGLPLQLEGQGAAIAKKVLVKCRVDQYVHRKADWIATAEKQASVKSAMQRILAAEGQV